MQKPALVLMFFFAASLACAPESPEVEFGTSAVPDGADGSDLRDSGIRILSDVTPPGVVDGSKTRDGAGGTDTRDATTADAGVDARGGGTVDDDAAATPDAATDRRADADAKGTDVATPSLDAAGDTA